ncbi:MAG: Hsp20/alpha crystallin family protein [Lachnospiraceae bacterium]|nr:Hsp20/alpha crystallin family protein [Lachnospiraceae bacterium]
MLMPSIFTHDLMDDFFNDFSQPVAYATKQKSMMRTDVSESENEYKLEIELPGYSKDDISAELENGYLTISANTEKSNDEKDNEGNFIRRERYTGSCSRSFYVGDAVEQEDIKAKFTDGVLTLMIPKEKEKPEVEQKKFIAIEG